MARQGKLLIGLSGGQTPGEVWLVLATCGTVRLGIVWQRKERRLSVSLVGGLIGSAGRGVARLRMAGRGLGCVR